MAAMAERLVIGTLLAAAFLASSASASAADTTRLTLHNLCPYPVWPLVTPNTGFPAICDNAVRLEGNGHGLVSFTFPPTTHPRPRPATIYIPPARADAVADRTGGARPS